MSLPLFRFLISVSLINEFKLNESLILDPFMMECKVAIEPVDDTYMERLMEGRLSEDELVAGTEGIFKLKPPVHLDVWKLMNESLMHGWTHIKKRTVEAAHPNAPVALVDFVMNNTIQTVVAPIQILNELIHRINTGGIGFTPRRDPGTIAPISGESSIKYAANYYLSSNS
ncbi:hypothetical protein CPB84DRAFT_1843011 [Gymnopilus junonius]|uniref:Uncharacterized protein n=1 Tax=Gymnopilus junonius TaxID=109634 RepID=A0A9P5NYM8_GYMJU|nr:hypothetical protein CPB84DRAFT_1843011 [Gymnopilus junonius]